MAGAQLRAGAVRPHCRAIRAVGSLTNPNEKLENCRVLERFSLDKDPFSNTTGDIYRAEIIEEELYLPPLQRWVAQWQTKVYNLENGDKIGESVVWTARYLEQ